MSYFLGASVFVIDKFPVGKVGFLDEGGKISKLSSWKSWVFTWDSKAVLNLFPLTIKRYTSKNSEVNLEYINFS